MRTTKKTKHTDLADQVAHHAKWLHALELRLSSVEDTAMAFRDVIRNPYQSARIGHAMRKLKVGDLVRRRGDETVGVIRTEANMRFGIEWVGSVRGRGWDMWEAEALESASG